MRKKQLWRNFVWKEIKENKFVGGPLCLISLCTTYYKQMDQLKKFKNDR
jgi:hypothetical protein